MISAMGNVQPSQTPASGNELGAKESESHFRSVFDFSSMYLRDVQKLLNFQAHLVGASGDW